MEAKTSAVYLIKKAMNGKSPCLDLGGSSFSYGVNCPYLIRVARTITVYNTVFVNVIVHLV